jgi:hypothetical protein
MDNTGFQNIKDFAKNYLSTFYNGEITDDEVIIANFLIDTVRTIGAQNKMIDVGCGPTIHHIVPFSSYIDEIYLADYLNQNLDSIRAWKDKLDVAHDWSTFISSILKIEFNSKSVTSDEITKKTNEIRAKLRTPLKCDLSLSNPLGTTKLKFNIVLSCYVLSQVGYPKEKWIRTLNNLTSLVEREDGNLIICDFVNTDFYNIKSENGLRTIKTTNLKYEDYYDGLIEVGFSSSKIKIIQHNINDLNHFGLNGLVTILARR